MDRFANPLIGSAAAQIAVHGLGDLVVGGVRIFCEQRRGRHDLPRLAVAALRDFFCDPGLLQHVQTVGSEPFDRGDVLIRGLRDRSGAGAYGRSVEMYGAGAAQSRAAAKFCSCEFESVAENPEERSFRRDADFLCTAVDAECDVGHVDPVVEFGNRTTWYSTAGKRGNVVRST